MLVIWSKPIQDTKKLIANELVGVTTQKADWGLPQREQSKSSHCIGSVKFCLLWLSPKLHFMYSKSTSGTSRWIEVDFQVFSLLQQGWRGWILQRPRDLAPARFEVQQWPLAGLSVTVTKMADLPL